MPKKKQSTFHWGPLVVTLLFVTIAALIFFRAARRRPAPRRRRAEPVITDTTVILSPRVKEVPGAEPTHFLVYRNDRADKVLLAGSWDRWATNRPMRLHKGYWVSDVRDLAVSLGRYEFKFLPDGEWETGPNRALYINEEEKMERPLDAIFSARIEEPDRVDVFFKDGVAAKTADIRVSLVPDTAVRELKWIEGGGSLSRLGYSVAGEFVTFCLDERVYGIAIPPTARVNVAGTFNGWNTDAGKTEWQLEDEDDDNVWKTTVSLPDPGAGERVFKFVVNGNRWLQAPQGAPNAVPDGRGNVNLEIDPALSEAPALQVYMAKPLALSNAYLLVVEGLGPRPAYRQITPGSVLDMRRSDKQLGTVIDRERYTTTYRLFAPRAKTVKLCFYDTPDHSLEGERSREPKRIVPLIRDADGVWEVTLQGIHVGRYYTYSVDGPAAAGEAFNPKVRIGDPYARAVAHAANNSIVIDPLATNRWFSGWTDDEYKAPAWEDVVIYEAHVRDLTIHPSSGVKPRLRGRYEGLLNSEGTGTGLDHLEKLGVNMIELLPVGEFENGTFEHGWGYSTAFFFAPEASYGRAPLQGSQYYEFKRLVNELHNRGFGVILDVVYNHVGGPDPFHMIDRKYYYRQDHEFKLSNFSGCGNDVRTEAPMMRRLIIENVLYWMREFHVDGFRFDLAELIDMETLMTLRDAARAENPDVLLISEPWSFRRDHKYELTGTGWAAWNNEFRDSVKYFVLGRGNRDDVKKAIRGSVETWTANPMQSINYLESHDDMCLADELSSHPRHDGRALVAEDAARNRLAATLLFTSLGIPMVAEGQEYIRSKRGIHNTFSHGDEINALNWDDRMRPLAATTLRYYAGMVRLRQGRAGTSLKWTNPVPADYYRWIEPAERHALGYVVNPKNHLGRPPMVVLVNAERRPVDFEVPFPAGRWRWVGNGTKIDPKNGFKGGEFKNKEGSVRKVRVPELTSYIFTALPPTRHSPAGVSP